MKQSGAVGRFATLRLLAQRFAFVSLVVAAVALMIVGKADVLLVERTRTLVADALAPVLDVMSRPAASIAEVVDSVRELASLRAENVRLRAENARLMHWQTVARRLEAETSVLHDQLNVIPDPDPSFVTARVIGDVGSAFGHSMLLGAGNRDGVRKGLAVLSGEVLVGHVAEVGERSSRLLLLTDINARIPVMLEASRTRAILAGDNRERPKLNYLAGAPVAAGDRVVTSSSGAAFPPGIPIGVVGSVTDGIIRVEPFVRRHELEFVTVVDYGLGGILPFDKPPVPERRRRGAPVAAAAGAEN
ncbi:rod shape-determining protein MreC [Magnetospirillum sp. UT-4]|uniref:rod shape-determining protein MreC n=1 Tax=Magnetospirillum sp. UT-4 TaxID=2681467 RepID=UPI001384277C|nr:rod shape-determining protein MreC [Magnetospirillum sp. UT-4]CAA7620476.1 Cell shape-determining protein MreC [Magnetospirillum sp. UT-4]